MILALVQSLPLEGAMPTPLEYKPMSHLPPGGPCGLRKSWCHCTISMVPKASFIPSSVMQQKTRNAVCPFIIKTIQLSSLSRTHQPLPTGRTGCCREFCSTKRHLEVGRKLLLLLFNNTYRFAHLLSIVKK